MRNFCCGVCCVLILTAVARPAQADLLGYWSADSTGGAGIVVPNDQGDSDLDGELVETTYTASGEGHTGQAGDYGVDVPGFDEDYVATPATEVTFEDFTVTAWVNGVQPAIGRDWCSRVTVRSR